MKFQEYVDIIDKLLQKHWAVVASPLAQDPYNPMRGTIEGKITLLDDSYIDFFEEISITPDGVEKSRYSYQYVKNQSEVFRYDNYPNHPGLRPPYHHKHVPQKRLAILKEAPKLIDILEEALRHMF